MIRSYFISLLSPYTPDPIFNYIGNKSFCELEISDQLPSV